MSNKPEKTLSTLDGARAILLEVATDDLIREEHAFIARYCHEKDLGQIVDLAWRHQFSEDRYAFKRDIRELQEIVALKGKEAKGSPK